MGDLGRPLLGPVFRAWVDCLDEACERNGDSRVAGDEVSFDVDEVDGCEDGYSKNLRMSIFGFEGAAAGTNTAGMEEGDGPAAERDDSEPFPTSWVLGKEPKDLTPSDLT